MATYVPLPIVNMAVPAPASIADLFNLQEPAYISLAADKLILHSNACTLEHVCALMDDNGLEKDNLKDVAFGFILSALVSSGALENSGADSPNLANYQAPAPAAVAAAIAAGAAAPPGPAPFGLVRRGFMNKFVGLARKIAVAAVHAYAQGVKDGDVQWLDSFKMVNGDFVSDSRMRMMLAMVCNSPNFPQLLDNITIGEIRGENKVLQYRITRLSSPGLVGQALALLPFDDVLDKMDNASIADYRAFAAGGVEAQIAAGGLAPFCRGNVAPNPAAPADTVISAFAAIPNAPNHPQLLRQVYIVMDELGTLPKKWYQGEKAMQSVGVADIEFRNIVRAIIGYQRGVAAVFDAANPPTAHQAPAGAVDPKAPW